MHTCSTLAYHLSIGIIWSLFFSAYSPYQDGESCDIFGFHHVYVGCHTRAYPLVSKIIENFLVCADNSYQEDDPCYDILFYFFMFLVDAILGHTP